MSALQSSSNAETTHCVIFGANPNLGFAFLSKKCNSVIIKFS